MGVTEPSQKSLVSSPVPGIIDIRHYKEGQSVPKGTVIISLERSEEILEVKRRTLLAESQAELQAAQYRAEILHKDLESTQSLFKTTQSISQDEVWKKQLDSKLAYSESEQLLTNEKKESLEAQIAKAQLEKKRIKAPFNGVIVKIYKREGESCNTQEPIFSIVDPRKIIFTTYIDVNSGHHLRLKQRVSIVFKQNNTELKKQGIVTFISPVVDPSSGLREIKVTIDNKDQLVTPGVNAWLSLN